MKIELRNLGKRFNHNWIFRRLDYHFESGQAYAITGANGSGKSTLLQVIAGATQQSEGTISYTLQQPVAPEDHYKQLALAAPYLDLVEEFSLAEFLAFHQSFKPFLPAFSIPAIIEYIGLEAAARKQIRNFSSGMKQRVKLAQAVFSNVPVVMLDEPTSNLDVKGIDLYQRLVHELCRDRLLIICSNDESEIGFCKERLHVSDFNVA